MYTNTNGEQVAAKIIKVDKSNNNDVTITYEGSDRDGRATTAKQIKYLYDICENEEQLLNYINAKSKSTDDDPKKIKDLVIDIFTHLQVENEKLDSYALGLSKGDATDNNAVRSCLLYQGKIEQDLKTPVFYYAQYTDEDDPRTIQIKYTTGAGGPNPTVCRAIQVNNMYFPLFYTGKEANYPLRVIKSEIPTEPPSEEFLKVMFDIATGRFDQNNEIRGIFVNENSFHWQILVPVNKSGIFTPDTSMKISEIGGFKLVDTPHDGACSLHALGFFTQTPQKQRQDVQNKQVNEGAGKFVWFKLKDKDKDKSFETQFPNFDEARRNWANGFWANPHKYVRLFFTDTHLFPEGMDVTSHPTATRDDNVIDWDTLYDFFRNNYNYRGLHAEEIQLKTEEGAKREAEKKAAKEASEAEAKQKAAKEAAEEAAKAAKEASEAAAKQKAAEEAAEKKAAEDARQNGDATNSDTRLFSDEASGLSF